MVGKKVAALPTFRDAFSYINTVKEAFHGEPAKFKDFLKLLDYYRSGRIDEDSLVTWVRQLLKDHLDLLAGFNVFLPQPKQPTELPDNIERQCEEANDLLNKIKTRFQSSDTHVPDSFVKILEDFKDGKKSEKEVLEEVHNLLYDHEDLRGDFLRFLQ